MKILYTKEDLYDIKTVRSPEGRGISVKYKGKETGKEREVTVLRYRQPTGILDFVLRKLNEERLVKPDIINKEN